MLALGSVGGTILLLCLVSALGLAIGQLTVRGVGIGVGGVLFAGLAFGHAGVHVDAAILEFVRELGLVLFVFSIGLQVGPGFIDSLRRQGLTLNVLAGSVVAGDLLLTALVHFAGGVDAAVAIGLASGAVTNTPSLAAAGQAIREVSAARVAAGGVALPAEALTGPGLGYAVAYPFGIAGTILCMLAIKALARIDPEKEVRELAQREEELTPRLTARTLEVTNSNFEGRTIGDIPGFGSMGLVISRVFAHGRVVVGKKTTPLTTGSLLYAIGTEKALDDLELMVGRRSSTDLKAIPARLDVQRIFVTDKGVLGKTVSELGLLERHGVSVTRITRSGVEFSAALDIPLHFGDLLMCLGEPHALEAVSAELGNEAKSLEHPAVLPIFVGIVVGVLVGTVPLSVPGMPVPVRLGLAGGPLMTAIVLSRLHNLGPLVWQLPTSANLILRELGIALFLACVGLKSGDKFVATLASGDGLKWMAWGAVITFVPIFVMAVIARFKLKLNYASLCGVIAGSMTDPPALSFASTSLGSDVPYVTYATVYPLVMIMRLVGAQVLVFLML